MPGNYSRTIFFVKKRQTVWTDVFTVYLIAPCRGLSESTIIHYLYIFNKKEPQKKKSRTHRVMRDNWRKECCRDLVVPCADMNTDSILYIILFSTSDCITVCHIWLPVIRKNKWLQLQTDRRYKFAQNNQPESQYRQCTRPASAFALPSKSLLCSVCWCPFWCKNL